MTAATELRCQHKLHGIIIGDGVVEVKCGSTLCGSKPGIVIIHEFNTRTGELVQTKRFKDTPTIGVKTNRRGGNHA